MYAELIQTGKPLIIGDVGTIQRTMAQQFTVIFKRKQDEVALGARWQLRARR